jgi:hypothetical protein
MCMEGCGGGLGRGYYKEGPVLDVMGRPSPGEGVLERPTQLRDGRNEKHGSEIGIWDVAMMPAFRDCSRQLFSVITRAGLPPGGKSSRETLRAAIR